MVNHKKINSFTTGTGLILCVLIRHVCSFISGLLYKKRGVSGTPWSHSPSGSDLPANELLQRRRGGWRPCSRTRPWICWGGRWTSKLLVFCFADVFGKPLKKFGLPPFPQCHNHNIKTEQWQNKENKKNDQYRTTPAENGHRKTKKHTGSC